MSGVGHGREHDTPTSGESGSLITPITDIINISMETSTFPPNLKEAHLRPEITSPHKNELKNYTPASTLIS